MEYGLYGPIVVHGDGEPVVDHEGIVMLDDLKLGADGQIAPVDVDILEQHSGREGPISSSTDAPTSRYRSAPASGKGGASSTPAVRASTASDWKVTVLRCSAPTTGCSLRRSTSTRSSWSPVTDSTS
jgi:hypothetical protein